MGAQMIISLYRLYVLALLVSSISSVAFAREWTSNNGKFKVEAEFVAIKDGKVVLEKPDGTFISVPLNLISKKDIEYIESTTGKKVTGESVDEKDSGDMLSEEDSSDDKGDEEKETPRVVKPRVIKLKGSKEGDPPGVVRDFGEQGWGINCLAFSGDGSILVAGKSDQMVAIFDVNEGSRLNITKRLEEVGTIESVAVSQDGTLVVAGGYKGIIKTWRMSRDGALKDGVPFAGHSEEISSIAISPDGRFALSGSRDKSARYWQINSGKEFEAYADFEDDVKAVWISADGLEGKATDGVVLAKIDLKTKEAVTTRIRDRASIQFAAFSPDGRYLAMNDSYTIRMWDLKTSKEMPPFKSNEIQWTGVFTPDGTRLISGANGILNVWDVKTQKRLGVLTNEGNGYVQAIAVSPDGEHVAGCASGASVNMRVFRLPAP
jgi:WD40 repeat protein